MNKIALAAFVSTSFFAARDATARPAYVEALPNVGTSDCGVCHVAETGGGARNAFGQDVEANMPFAGPDDATWQAIFCADSDGDSKTNGEELGDPCGTWKAGDADPDGNVTRPGDDAETTEDVGECDGDAAPTCDLAAEDAGGCGCASANGSDVGLLALAGGSLLLTRRRRR